MSSSTENGVNRLRQSSLNWLVPCLVYFGCGALLGTSALAQTLQNELRVLDKLGSKSGETVSVQANIPGKAILLYPSGNTFPCVGELDASGESKSFSIAVPMTNSPLIAEIRTIGSAGVSNSRRWLITEAPWEYPSNNESPTTPFRIASGIVYQDECPANERNYYVWTVDRVSKIRIQSWAIQLDSRARLTFTVSEGTRKTIFTETALPEADLQFDIECKPGIEYRMSISDHIYRSGPEYRYAFQLIQEDILPLSNNVTTPLMQKWEQSSAMGGTRTGDSVHPRAMMIRPPSPLPQIQYAEQGANEVPLLVDGPTRILGAWETNQDLDSVEIEMAANQEFAFEILSQRLGEPTDPFLTIDRVHTNDKNEKTYQRVFEMDDAPNPGTGEFRFGIKDLWGVWKASESGRYRWTLRDLQRSKRIRAPQYVFEIRQPAPGFAAAVVLFPPVIDFARIRPVSPTVGFNQQIIGAFISRFDGYTGPIDIQTVSEPNVAPIDTLRIGANQSSGFRDLSLRPGDQLQELRMNFISTSPLTPEVRSTVPQFSIVWEPSDTVRDPILRSDYTTFLAMRNKHSTSCSVNLESSDAANIHSITVAKESKTQVKVRLNREKDNNAKAEIRFRGLPAGLNVPPFSIEANQSEGVTEWNVPGTVAAGEYFVYALAEIQIKVPDDSSFVDMRGKQVPIHFVSDTLHVIVEEKKQP